MKRLSFAAVTFLICFSQSAQAADSVSYLGVGLASSSISTACADGLFSSCNTPSSNPKGGGQIRVVGGYNFNRHFGIEAGYSDLGTYRVHNYSNSNVGEFKASAITLAVRGGNTFSNGFSIFGKFGLASVNSHYTTQPSWTLAGTTDQRSSGFVVGVAGQYDLNDTIGFRASMEVIKYTDSEFNVISSGPILMVVFKL
jgi:hypothetical protein